MKAPLDEDLSELSLGLSKVRLPDRRRWRKLAHAYLATVGTPEERGDLRALVTLLQQEYARGYIDGHDAGFDEGICK